MKTIILVFLLSVMAFGQSGKSVLTQAQKDSINGMIGKVTVDITRFAPTGTAKDGSVDWSNYFDDAVTYLKTVADGGTVYFPIGKYALNISLGTGISIQGAGSVSHKSLVAGNEYVYGAVFVPTKDNDTIISVSFGAGYLSIRDITIFSVANGDTARIGIYVDTGHDLQIENVRITPAHGNGIDTTYGIYLDDGNSIQLRDIYVYELDIGLYANSFQHLAVENCRFARYRMAGVLINDSYESLIKSCSFEGKVDTTSVDADGASYGIWNKSSLQTTIMSTYHEPAGKYANSHCVYVSETTGYNSNINIIGGKFDGSTIAYAIKIDATRTYTNIWGTYIRSLVAPIYVEKGDYKYVDVNCIYSPSSLSDERKVKTDRYWTDNFNWTKYSIRTYNVTGLTHSDAFMDGYTYMQDSSMFSKGITTSSFMTNAFVGYNTGRINSVVAVEGTGAYYGTSYLPTKDTLEVEIKLANTPSNYWNFMKAKIQLSFGSYTIDKAFVGEVSVSKLNNGLSPNLRSFTVDSLFMPSTSTNAPIFRYWNSSDTNFVFDIIPSGSYSGAQYCFAGWTEAINVKDIIIRPKPSVSFDFEASAYFESLLPNIVPYSNKLAIDTLCLMLKDSLVIDSLSEKFDRIYLLANADTTSALTSLVYPDSDKAIIINALTFTQNKGFTNPDTGYINLQYNLVDNGINISQNDLSIGIYSRVNGNDAGNAFGSAITGSHTTQLEIAGATNMRYYVNSDTYRDVTMPDSTYGLFVINRDLVDTARVYWNGIQFDKYAETSTGLPNLDFYVFTRNKDGLPEAAYQTYQQYAFLFIGKSFTAAEQLKIYRCIEYYLDKIGAGVM